MHRSAKFYRYISPACFHLRRGLYSWQLTCLKEEIFCSKCHQFILIRLWSPSLVIKTKMQISWLPHLHFQAEWEWIVLVNKRTNIWQQVSRLIKSSGSAGAGMGCLLSLYALLQPQKNKLKKKNPSGCSEKLIKFLCSFIFTLWKHWQCN